MGGNAHHAAPQGPPDQMRARMEARITAMRSILTTEQQVQFDANLKRMQANMPHQGPGHPR